ncbi:hypothetical protein C0993_009377 [Termitomyces sp. T159_Od127]|nr:hypothetical protein C0993_009377 [Termitomyces sp. T159_Od127]
MRRLLFLSLVQIIQPIVCQQIWDIWQTKWDRTNLFTPITLSTPINFVTPGPSGDANIVVDDSTVYQSIAGFGASLTDSSALLLSNLKSKNAANYNTLLNYMFSSADGTNTAGLNYIRLSIGASDFSAGEYSLDDTNGDTSFASFSIDRAPSYLFSVLQDIKAINSNIKVHIVPWSPPAWMKTTDPTYLLKAVQGFQSKGIPIYAISIQNEPENSNPTYPTSTLTPAVEGQIGTALRTLLNNNGLSNVRVIGYEHNWDNAGSYPITLMQDAGSSFSGAAFHCYAGTVSNQDTFHNAFPNKVNA